MKSELLKSEVLRSVGRLLLWVGVGVALWFAAGCDDRRPALLYHRCACGPHSFCFYPDGGTP